MSTVLVPPSVVAATNGTPAKATKIEAKQCGTSVPDRPVDLEAFRMTMLAEGLPHELVPAKLSDVRAFQNACAAVATKRAGKDAKGTFVAVTRLNSDNDECVYMVTQGEKHPERRDLDHKNAMRVVYNKKHAADPAMVGMGFSPISVEPIDNARYEHLRDIESKIRLGYEQNRGKLPGTGVRTIIRGCFRQWHATRWMPGASVWWVPAEYADKLDALKTLLLTTYGNDCHVRLDDIASSVQDVEQAAGDHAHAEAAELLKDIATLLDAKNVKPDQMERVHDRRQQIIDYVTRMESMVGGEIAQMNVALQLVDAQMIGLLARASA